VTRHPYGRARVYDLATVRAKLAEFVAAHGYKTAAEKCGCTESYLRHILHPTIQKHPGAAVLAAWGWHVLDKSRSSSAAVAQKPSLAILPFEDLSPQKDQDWFCDGMTDEGNPGSGASCTSGSPGICAAGHRQCLAGGTLSCVADIAPGSRTEVCNGLVDVCGAAPGDREGFDIDDDGHADCGAYAAEGTLVEETSYVPVWIDCYASDLGPALEQVCADRLAEEVEKWKNENAALKQMIKEQGDKIESLLKQRR
jgi:hypothetical protein